MCGIAGIFYFDGRRSNAQEIKAMTDVIAHRGPDGDGHWLNADNTLALGHRRLSIIDLSVHAAQPMHYQGRYTITYNGEIYNYIELRNELIKKGYTFISQSDTEVITAAYDAYGYDCVNYFDGMFAFALWDNLKQELYCARDRFGEKPLFYYYVPGKQFVFGSEMKTLWAVNAPKTHNYKMIFYYLAYDVVENALDKSETFFNNITRLEAAHYLIVNPNGDITKKRYWDIKLKEINTSITVDDASDKFKELFTDSIVKRLRSDVALGSSLSGGIDSSSIVMLINKLGNQTSSFNTFSARFDDPELDEGRYMDIVRRRSNINVHDTFCNFTELMNDFEKVLYHQEEPFMGPSILAAWDVMRLAKHNNVTVLLDGQGADEYLAGYLKYYKFYFRNLYIHNRSKFLKEFESYKKLRNQKENTDLRFIMDALAPSVVQSLGKLKRSLSDPFTGMGIAPEFSNQFKDEPPPFQRFDSLNEALYFDTCVYGLEKLLRFADRNSMAFSREIRLPFLSHKMVEFAFSLPPGMKLYQGWTKYVLRKAMKGILPEEISWRIDKKGFEPPVKKWLSTDVAKERIIQAEHKLIEDKLLNSRGTYTDDWKKMELAAFLEM